MTSPVFILPTSGPRTYRGKYPNRARSVSSGTGGLHVELNDGTRLWTARPVDHFADLPPYGHNMAGFRAKAVPMTAEQYETLKAAGEVLRTRASYCGRGPRAEIESRVRRMIESIVPATREPLSRFREGLTPGERAKFDACSPDDRFTIACEELNFDPDAGESYRFDFDRLSGTGILVRLSDDRTSLRYTGSDAERMRDASPDELATEAAGVEFN